MLELRGVSILHDGVFIVRRASFSLPRGRVLGLVGASGSGKSLLSLAILGLLPHAIECRGIITWKGKVLSEAPDHVLTQLRGTEIGMVFQNTSAAFDPLITIGEQLADLFTRHKNMTNDAARQAALAVLRSVEWPDEIDPFDRYPHEISGGQRQRALIAMAIALDPELIIADEPTASLDVTTAKSILDLLKRLAKKRGAALLVISHDLPALATIVDEIAYLRGSIIDRTYPITALADQSAAPELAALYAASVPERKRDRPALDARASVIRVSGLTVIHHKPRLSFFATSERVAALAGVSLTLAKGECVALVGESGSGKSTLARTLIGIDRKISGSVDVLGLDPAEPKTRRGLWEKVRLIFQDPISAMDPNWTVRHIVAEPLALLDGRLNDADRSAMVAVALQNSGIATPLFDRYPHQLSGGQLQRVALARAIVTRPDILILDEPISALDADARGQVLDLLAGLMRETGLTLVMITHDLGVARAIADRVIVLKQGKIIEEGETLSVLSHPEADYTKALLAASPLLNARSMAEAAQAGGTLAGRGA